MTLQLQMAKNEEQSIAEKVACVMARVEADLLRLNALKVSSQNLEVTDPGFANLKQQIRMLVERIQFNKIKAASLWA